MYNKKHYEPLRGQDKTKYKIRRLSIKSLQSSKCHFIVLQDRVSEDDL